MTTEPTPASTSTPTPATTEQPSVPAVATSEATSAPAVPTPSAKPSVWPLRFDLTILVLLLVLSFFVASFIATNSDLRLHLAIGKRLSEGKFTFGVDPYSWATEAFDGQPAVYW